MATSDFWGRVRKLAASLPQRAERFVPGEIFARPLDAAVARNPGVKSQLESIFNPVGLVGAGEEFGGSGAVGAAKGAWDAAKQLLISGGEAGGGVRVGQVIEPEVQRPVAILNRKGWATRGSGQNLTGNPFIGLSDNLPKETIERLNRIPGVKAWLVQPAHYGQMMSQYGQLGTYIELPGAPPWRYPDYGKPQQALWDKVAEELETLPEHERRLGDMREDAKRYLELRGQPGQGSIHHLKYSYDFLREHDEEPPRK